VNGDNSTRHRQQFRGAVPRARLSRNLLSASFFRDVWIERRLPRRAIFAAALWHIAFIAMPLPQISGPKTNPAFANTQLTWSGQIEDFPLLEIRAAKPKLIPRVTPSQLPRPQGADAFHPRQRILLTSSPQRIPANSNQSCAPPLAPKLLQSFEYGAVGASGRAGASTSRNQPGNSKKLRPREKRFATNPNAPAPEMQISEQRSQDLTLAMANAAPERPKLQINAGVAPRVAQRNRKAQPTLIRKLQRNSLHQTVRANTDRAFRNTWTVRASRAAGRKSRAHVTISPEGKKPGVPGGTADAQPTALEIVQQTLLAERERARPPWVFPEARRAARMSPRNQCRENCHAVIASTLYASRSGPRDTRSRGTNRPAEFCFAGSRSQTEIILRGGEFIR